MIKSNTSRWLRSLLKILTWTPQRCRFSSAEIEPTLSIQLNLLFSLASTISAANLYYSYPVLDKIANDFSVTYERAALIPTLLQAGYGAGIFFLCPLGDRLPLRPFILILMLISATIWIAVCLTSNFTAFAAISFFNGITSITPQLMIPLASGLATPARRATAISIVFSGLMLGMLLPRVISGIIAQYTSWRNVYWVALGLQYLVWSLLWLYMPEYPAISTNDMTYTSVLWSVFQLISSQPILAYACIMVFFSNAVFASYWTTLTAFLSGPLYNWSSLQIGLFALVGVAPLLFVPPYSRVVIDRFATNFSVLLGLVLAIVGSIIGLLTGRLSIVGPVVQAISVDCGVQTASIAYRAAIYAAVPDARNRTNVAFTVRAFIGQLAGTSIGNRLFAQGGWSATGIFNISFLAAAIGVTLIRGPQETAWIGWRGGMKISREDA